ncbi:MAG TPA: hypothetical protein VNT26_21285 [Candidatus Sulfotelmatobacter sp.]|nr:hypothetical protein [Candidatus Sulfotelmatobacter sp.]
MHEDEGLHQALRAWQVNDPLPPRFGQQVWQRIAREEAQASVGFRARLSTWLGQMLARPSWAVSYVTVLLGAGLVAGYWHARLDNSHAAEELGVRYVQMLDPYQMPHGLTK